FKKEEPVNGMIQFLDLKIFVNQGLCWRYDLRQNKALLSYRSAHSKLVKEGIVKNILKSALSKSCCHQVHTSLMGQISRLKNAGYPFMRLEEVFGRILLEGRKYEKKRTNEKWAVIPYRHGTSQAIKKAAMTVGTDVVFTADSKIRRFLNSRDEKEKIEDLEC